MNTNFNEHIDESFASKYNPNDWVVCEYFNSTDGSTIMVQPRVKAQESIDSYDEYCKKIGVSKLRGADRPKIVYGPTTKEKCKKYKEDHYHKKNFSERLNKAFGVEDSHVDDSHLDSEHELYELIRNKFDKAAVRYPLDINKEAYALVVKTKENLYLGELTFAKKSGPGYDSFNWKEMYRDNHVAPCVIPNGTKINILAAQDGDFEESGKWSNLFIYLEDVPYVYSTHLSEDQWHNFKTEHQSDLVDAAAKRVLDILNKILDGSTIL